MPPNYTNREFMQMREQAIVNAREMQRRAAIKGIQPQNVQEHISNQSQYESNDDFEHNTLRFEKHPATEEKAKQKPHHAANRQNVVQKTSASNDERMLIMTLLLILVADGADRMLIFALMYIMM